MKYFISDTHWGHENVLRYDSRPFSSIQEHDEQLVRRWNEVVKPSDVVYHLGDFSWHKHPADTDALLSQLHGTKILILGNHDERVVARAKGWAKVTPYLEIKEDGQRICLFHYRMTVWNQSHRGSWALHGHSHGTLPVTLVAKTMDVGCMVWGYAPISLDLVAEEMSRRQFLPVDGHRADR